MRGGERSSRTCPTCGRKVRVVVPKGGDGSALVYVRHDNREGDYCMESRSVVRDG